MSAFRVIAIVFVCSPESFANARVGIDALRASKSGRETMSKLRISWLWSPECTVQRGLEHKVRDHEQKTRGRRAVIRPTVRVQTQSVLDMWKLSVNGRDGAVEGARTGGRTGSGKTPVDHALWLLTVRRSSSCFHVNGAASKIAFKDYVFLRISQNSFTYQKY